MNLDLCKQLPYQIKYENKTYRLRPYFDVVLRVFEIQHIDWLSDTDKIDLSLSHLVIGKKPKGLNQKIELLVAVYQLLFGKEKGNEQAKVFDFVQDAPYIYAGFLECYGIDLFGLQGKLHWFKFISLFTGLAEETRMMKIISIRAKPLPKQTKYNAEEIEHLLRLKQQYALNISEEERMEQYAKGLKKVACALQGLACEDNNENLKRGDSIE